MYMCTRRGRYTSPTPVLHVCTWTFQCSFLFWPLLLFCLGYLPTKKLHPQVPIQVCIYRYIHMYMCMYTYTHMYTYIHTHIYIYTHKYVHIPVSIMCTCSCFHRQSQPIAPCRAVEVHVPGRASWGASHPAAWNRAGGKFGLGAAVVKQVWSKGFAMGPQWGRRKPQRGPKGM